MRARSQRAIQKSDHAQAELLASEEDLVPLIRGDGNDRAPLLPDFRADSPETFKLPCAERSPVAPIEHQEHSGAVECLETPLTAFGIGHLEVRSHR